MGKKKYTAVNPEKRDGPDRLTFHYIKSNSFRVVHADGAYGGISPKGDTIQMAIFSERRPIPLQITHAITGDGDLKEEVERLGRDGFVREVEVDLVMSIPTAKSVAKWLSDKIEQAEKLMEAPP